MTTVAVADHWVALGRLRGGGGEALADSEKAQGPVGQVEFGRGVALRHNAGGKAISNSVMTLWSTEEP